MSDINTNNFEESLDKVLKMRNEIEEDIQFIKTSSEQYRTKQKTKRQRRIRIYSSGVAAAFVLVIFTTYFLPTIIKLDSVKIFSENYDKYLPELETRSLNQEDSLLLAIKSYSSNESEKALRIIISLLKYEPNNQLYRFNHALFLMELERYNESYYILESLMDNSFMNTEALWYMALIDIKNENWAPAKNKLKQIKSLDRHSHNSEIPRILKKIWLRR